MSVWRWYIFKKKCLHVAHCTYSQFFIKNFILSISTAESYYFLLRQNLLLFTTAFDQICPRLLKKKKRPWSVWWLFLFYWTFPKLPAHSTMILYCLFFNRMVLLMNHSVHLQVYLSGPILSPVSLLNLLQILHLSWNIAVAICTLTIHS